MWEVAVRLTLVFRGLIQHQGLTCQRCHAAFPLLWEPHMLHKKFAFQPFAAHEGVKIWTEKIYSLGMAAKLK